MEIHFGNGGWVRVADEDLPGNLFVRLQPDERGRWRAVDFYLQGDWRHIVGADLREFDLSVVEEIASSRMPHISTRDEAGPDLRTLASSYNTRYGPGVYAGRGCETCDAPLRGGSPRSIERWSNDWVALSWFAQRGGERRIARPKPKPHKDAPAFKPRKVPPLQRPTSGLTDEFLSHVRDAYEQAVAEGKAPAPELARQMGEPDAVRTVHKWVSVARSPQRGIMPPASRRGRAGY